MQYLQKEFHNPGTIQMYGEKTEVVHGFVGQNTEIQHRVGMAGRLIIFNLPQKTVRMLTIIINHCSGKTIEIKVIM